MNWKGQFYVDLALPFGLQSAPRIFTCFADVLLGIFSDVGSITNIQHYLDDFLLAAPAASAACEDNLKESFNLCEQLGVPIAPDKTAGPSTSMSYLGFILDTDRLELRLPQEKLSKIRRQLESWHDQKFSTKRDLLSLVGVLQHCCQAIILGHPFLRRLLDRAHSVSELHHFVHLSLWERDDIAWWIKLLQEWNGKSLFYSLSGNVPQIALFHQMLQAVLAMLQFMRSAGLQDSGLRAARISALLLRGSTAPIPDLSVKQKVRARET